MPVGVAVTADGLLVVSERDGKCITILDRNGKKIRSFSSLGQNRGELRSPRGVAISSNGTILVTDDKNNSIHEFTIEGKCISSVGEKGEGPLQFN